MTGLLAVQLGVPARNWRGALKGVFIGVVCGFAAFAAKWVARRWGVGGLWFPASFFLALLIYPLSGGVGGFVAWASFCGLEPVWTRLKKRSDEHAV